MASKSSWGALAVGVVLATSATARAQYAQPAPYVDGDTHGWGNPYLPPAYGGADRGAPETSEQEGREQRLSSAAAMTGLSAGVATAGLVTYIVSQHSASSCGLSGCFTHANQQLEVASSALAAAGAGMALVSVPTLLDAMFVDRGPARRPGRMGWGMALTALGAGSVASMGALALQLHALDGNDFMLASDELEHAVDDDMLVLFLVVQGMSAATYLGVGIPLWAGGGRSTEDPTDWPQRLTLVPTGNGGALHLSF